MSEIPDLYSLQLLKNKAIAHRLIILPRPPRSADDIVTLFGCRLDQVIKSLVFVGDCNVIACVPGNLRVDVKKLCQAAQAKKLTIASPAEVKKITGFDVGGVCPFLPLEGITAILDRSCLERERVNIGAGTVTMGLELATTDLKNLWPGIIADISRT